VVPETDISDQSAMFLLISVISKYYVSMEFNQETRKIESIYKPNDVDQMYYSLELDVDLVDSAPVPDSATDDRLHPSIRNLFSLLSQRLDPVALNDYRNFLIQAKPTQSKWHSDERIGQEQLYHSLDHVLNVLKSVNVLHYI
jgi:hypothetical protein